MRIAIIGDVHDRHERLERVLGWLASDPPQAALLVGDLGRDPPWTEPDRHARRGEHDDSVRRVLACVRARLGCPLAFVPGNHDLPDPVTDVDGVNCDGRVVDLGGLRVAGLGGAGPTRFGFPYEWTEAEAERALGALQGDDGPIDVLISHTPPARTSLDRTATGRHVGSEALRSGLARMEPRLVVCGHIHESWGLERVDGVPCLNAGALGPPFGEEILWLVHWSSGRPATIRSLHGAGDGPPRSRDWC